MEDNTALGPIFKARSLRNEEGAHTCTIWKCFPPGLSNATVFGASPLLAVEM